MNQFRPTVIGSRGTAPAIRQPARCSRYRHILLCALVLLVGGCSTVPFTQRQQLNLVSEGTLTAASQQQYDEFLTSHEVIRNTRESAMVQRVGERIRSAVEQFLTNRNQLSQLSGYQWEFSLVNSPEVNAWAMPGGKVTVYSGILPITRDEAGLAAVMAHEVAHVIARHGNERMSQELLTQMGGQALSAVLASQPEASQALWMKVFGVGATLGVVLPYSRLQESEADHLGLIFMAMAGYDPHAAIEVWQRMAQQGGAGVPEFLSTHPTDQTRIQQLNALLPEAMGYYQPR
ncbi:MAG: M48 family metallopeptidase [Pedobacter sp.]